MEHNRHVLSLLVLSLLPLSGCDKVTPVASSSAQPAPSMPSVSAPIPSKPVYGWKSLATETLQFQALDSHSFVIPNEAKLRVSVHADSGIFGGVFYRQSLPRKPLRQPQFAASACPLLSVIQGEATCKVKSSSQLVYVIRDKRSELALSAGALFATRGATKPLENATAPNRVSINLEKWACVAHCPSSP